MAIFLISENDHRILREALRWYLNNAPLTIGGQSQVDDVQSRLDMAMAQGDTAPAPPLDPAPTAPPHVELRAIATAIHALADAQVQDTKKRKAQVDGTYQLATEIREAVGEFKQEQALNRRCTDRLVDTMQAAFIGTHLNINRNGEMILTHPDSANLVDAGMMQSRGLKLVADELLGIKNALEESDAKAAGV